jgi:hypothetical protein
VEFDPVEEGEVAASGDGGVGRTAAGGPGRGGASGSGLGPTGFVAKGRATPEHLEGRVLDLLRSVVPVTEGAS